MRRLLTTSLLLCLSLSACASGPSPEDRQMANTMCDQGKVLLAQGKMSEARDLYQSAVSRDGESARAWNGLGASYAMLNKKAEALDAFQHAVGLAPDDIMAVNNLARAYMESGDPDAAIGLLQRAAEDPYAPAQVKQNLAIARKLSAAKNGSDGMPYAELGSFPTEGMANGHVAKIKRVLEDEADKLVITVEPEVRVTGGVPTFAVKAMGASPADICEALMGEGFPCIPHGK